jgi:hypothetical protein
MGVGGGCGLIIIKHKGDFRKTESFFKRSSKINYRAILEKYAKMGVEALAAATPIDTGKTAASWGYEIDISKGQFSISWTNSNVVDGVPIVLVLQYGHATPTGGYVQGYDFINPALKPIFDAISEEVWREVTRL